MPPDTPDDAVKAEVIAAGLQLCDAMGADDFDTIDSILADELYYRHSNGRMDLKPSYIESLRARKRVIHFEDVDVRVYGDIALVIGGYVIESTARDGSNPGHVEARALQAWAKRDGRWQLVAHQGTAEPKPS